MARKCSERVVEMKKQYFQLHKQGLSAVEIAEKFELTPCTVYSHLQEIADENHVSRKSLLIRDYPENRSASAVTTSLKKTKTKDLLDEATKLINTIDKTYKQIEKLLA